MGDNGCVETTSTDLITVIVVDDQALVRAGLVALLGLENDIEVVGEAGDSAGALALIEAKKPQIALIDIELGSDNGLELAALIRDRHPATERIIVTTFGRPGYLARAMAVGASGFLVKDAGGARLADAIRRVAAGLRVIDSELAAEAMALGPNPLSEREREVLAAAGAGATVAEIAARVHLAEGTVRNHLSAAMTKLGARTRMEAHQRATAVGWL